MTREEKKEEELRYAKFFLSKFNPIRKCDYVAVPNKNELTHDSDVDVYAKSSVCEELKFQIKIIDKEYMPGFIQREKEAQQNPNGSSKIHVRDLKPIDWAKQTIKECLEKYGDEKARKELILLLCVYHDGELNREYAKTEFVEYQQVTFKGIYLVDLPHISPLGSGIIKEYQGQLTPIKNMRMLIENI